MMASLTQQLRSGRSAIGCWIELMPPLAAQGTVQAGHRCVVIGPEHRPGSIRDAVHIIQAVQGQRLRAADPGRG